MSTWDVCTCVCKCTRSDHKHHHPVVYAWIAHTYLYLFEVYAWNVFTCAHTCTYAKSAHMHVHSDGVNMNICTHNTHMYIFLYIRIFTSKIHSFVCICTCIVLSMKFYGIFGLFLVFDLSSIVSLLIDINLFCALLLLFYLNYCLN